MKRRGEIVKNGSSLCVLLSISLPIVVLVLYYYIIGPAVADIINFLAAQYLLLVFGLLFLIMGVLLFMRNCGKYKLLCVPSMVVSALFFFGYYVSGFLQG
mgnify:CR=1 FL=1